MIRQAPMLSLVPPPVPLEPPPPLEGIALEDAARAELARSMNLNVETTAPTWRQVMFSGQKIQLQIPRPPGRSLARLSDLEAPPTFPKDEVGIAAHALWEGLQNTKPRGLVPKSVTALPPLPPSRDVLSAWLRKVFLVTGGPGVLPVLVAAGYLTPGDVATVEGVYPEGLEAERKAATEAAIALTAAGQRSGTSVELPAWLNDQLLTLMDDHSPADLFQSLYDQPAQNQGGGGSLGGKATKMAVNAAPDTIKGDVIR